VGWSLPVSLLKAVLPLFPQIIKTLKIVGEATKPFVDNMGSVLRVCRAAWNWRLAFRILALCQTSG
jgi:hypothetical protein